MAPVCAVVVAGGSGQRFGNPGGKQLVNVAGRPLMSWSIRAFDRSNKVGHIVVVCPSERRAEMRRLAIDPFDYDTPISFADAGDTRQDSTRAGVHAVPAGFEYVAIHDGARPLITTEAIDHAIDVLVATARSTVSCAVNPRSTHSRSSTAITSSRRRRVSFIGLRRRRRSLASML